MSKLSNPSRGEVPFREAGKNARLVYSIDAMERFYGELGDDYRVKLFNQIAEETPPQFLRTAFETMLVDGDADGFPFGLTNDAIKTRLLDAISLGMNGKDFATAQKEAEAEEEERQKKILEKIEANPKMALMNSEILSKLLLSEEAQSDSDSPTSEDAPTSISADTQTES